MKHKIMLSTEECFEVLNVLENHIEVRSQRENVDKELLSAYKKLNVKIPNQGICNYDYKIKEFQPRKK
jgi:hypothetical protein